MSAWKSIQVLLDQPSTSSKASQVEDNYKKIRVGSAKSESADQDKIYQDQDKFIKIKTSPTKSGKDKFLKIRSGSSSSIKADDNKFLKIRKGSSKSIRTHSEHGKFLKIK